MKTLISALAIAAALAGSALAQPAGGPDAKGNAPLKPGHTVNDGAAKHGHNSFTEGQARKHIEKAGFTGVTGLAKGDDGVWRGQAMRNNQTVAVAMDFKGNVSTGAGPAAAMTPAPMGAMAPADRGMTSERTTSTAAAEAPAADMAAAPAKHHRHHRRHHATSRCANPTPNGVACSGVDKNTNGISDKEDHAIQKGARP